MRKIIGFLMALVLGFAMVGSTLANQSTTKQSGTQKQEQMSAKHEKKKKKKHSRKKKELKLKQAPSS